MSFKNEKANNSKTAANTAATKIFTLDQKKVVTASDALKARTILTRFFVSDLLSAAAAVTNSNHQQNSKTTTNVVTNALRNNTTTATVAATAAFKLGILKNFNIQILKKNFIFYFT